MTEQDIIDIIGKEEQPEPEVKRPKVFKDYYADPGYRQRHLDRMQEKLECDTCGIRVSRSNMSKHRRTRHHIRVSEKIREVVDKRLDNTFLSKMIKFIQDTKRT